MDEHTDIQALSGSGRPLVLGMRVDSIEFDGAAELVSRWMREFDAVSGCFGDAVAEKERGIRQGRPSVAMPHPADLARARTVYAANVHMVMEAWDDASYRALVNRADLVLPDGQPMVWALRALGTPQHRRVRVSPDFLLRLFAEAEQSGSSVGLYGGGDKTLPVFKALLAERFPRLRVGFAYAPPFRPLTPEEDRELVARIRSAGVQLLLVGLGCPKQERWMDEHRDRLSCVMMGVGAAFDLLGGRTKEAPRWTRDIGLEWAYRLAQEPRRLWRRHAKHDARFVALLIWQVARRVAKRRSANCC